MAIADINSIINTYLNTLTTLIALTSTRIYAVLLPEDPVLPAVSYNVIGGPNDPYIPGRLNPSVQFDCWAENEIDAWEVYRKLYDGLQGVQFKTVGDYQIQSAIEEVQGQVITDAEISGFFRVMCIFSLVIRAE